MDLSGSNLPRIGLEKTFKRAPKQLGKTDLVLFESGSVVALYNHFSNHCSNYSNLVLGGNWLNQLWIHVGPGLDSLLLQEVEPAGLIVV